MSIKSRMFAAAATLTLVGCLSAVAAVGARAATPACGMSCLSIFSKELGNPQQPGPVEDILDGAATPGQPVILKQASGSDSSEDTLPRTVGSGLVSDFYAAGMVSDDANSHFGSLRAVQIEYAPMGIRSGLCVGLATKRPHENEGLTLRPCSVPGVTVFILDFAASPATGYFAIVNAATTDFDHPFAMSLNPDELASRHQLLQILVRRLQFRADEATVRDSQLWGVHFGPYN